MHAFFPALLQNHPTASKSTAYNLEGSCLLFRTVCGNILNENKNYTLKNLRNESNRLIEHPKTPVIRAGVISYDYLDPWVHTLQKDHHFENCQCNVVIASKKLSIIF